MIIDGTWGRMRCIEMFNIMTYQNHFRFERVAGGLLRRVDGSSGITGSWISAKAARVVWADRAEGAFDRDDRGATQ